MSKDLIIGKKNLTLLIDYVNTCNIEEMELYEKFINTISYFSVYYDAIDKNKLTDEQKKYLKCCAVLNNIFKHKKELNGDIEELKIVRYGTDLSCCILNAPFGDVVFFQNSNYVKGLKDKSNYEYFHKYIENQRLDIFLSNLKKVVGELNE